MRLLIILPLLACSMQASAQPFAIGNADRTFYDAARDRDVACEIHYPAVAAGDEQPMALGAFPVLVVGHGFVMTVDAYVYLWEYLVPLGYIVILPTTEGGFAPDHAAFGADLAFLSAQMTNENTDAGSLFFDHVAAGRALAGHSMGGGAALLGAATNADITAVMVLAPAETSPSAIAAAAQISVPTLVFGADEDCVTPIATNQQPMYDALNSPCKALVNVLGGGHCYFGDDNFLCSFGELTCGPDLTISREQQQDIVLDLGTLWLDAWLTGNTAALAQLSDSLDLSDRITAQHICLVTATDERSGPTCRVVFDRSSERLSLSCTSPGRIVAIVDMLGRRQQIDLADGDGSSVDTHRLRQGLHLALVYEGNGGIRHLPFVIMR